MALESRNQVHATPSSQLITRRSRVRIPPPTRNRADSTLSRECACRCSPRRRIGGSTPTIERCSFRVEGAMAPSLLLCDRLKERCERRSCAGRRLVLVPSERLPLRRGDARKRAERLPVAHERKGARGGVAGRRSQRRVGLRGLWCRGSPLLSEQRQGGEREFDSGVDGAARRRAGSVRCMAVARDGERPPDPFAWLRACGLAAAYVFWLMDRWGSGARGASS